MVRFSGFRCMIVLLLSVLVVHAQVVSTSTEKDSKPFRVLRVDVGLVQVDTIVTDSDGNPVTDLTADDFIVLQDGKPQDITNFSIVRTKTPSLRTTVVQKTAVQEQEDLLQPPPPPVKLKPEQVRRSIALVVDDLGLSFESIVRTRESLKKWIDNEMQPGDLVAIVTTFSGVGALQQFTTDKRMLHAAIDKIIYSPHSRVGTSAFAPFGAISGLSSAIQAEVDADSTLGTLESIQYIIAGLKNIPGRKSLILFSESMELSEIAEMTSTGSLPQNPIFFIQQRMQRLFDEAHRAAVVIYAIDPRGVVYTGGTAEDNFAAAGIGSDDPAEAVQGAMRAVMGRRGTELFASQDGMVQLTNETGGLFEQGRNDIFGALRDVANDGEVYYLLGYQPDEETISKLEEKGRQHHSIEVRVKRPGLKARSRSGISLASESEEGTSTRRERIAGALISPFNSGTLPVRLTALFSQTENNNLCINALLHFDTNQLHFTEENGEKKAVVEIVTALFNPKGDQLEQHDRNWHIIASGDMFDEMQKHGVVFLMRIPVKKPGAYQMRVVLSDTGSEQMGSASHFIEVPDIDKGNLALSGIALTQGLNQTASVGDSQEGMIANTEVHGTTAVRVFQPGDTITWAYQAINIKTGSDKKTQLQTYVRLFHEGQEVYTENPSEISSFIPEDGSQTIITGRMELKKIDPGDYILQVVVRDRLAKKDHQIAVQSINFEIQNPKLSSLSPLRSP